MEKLLLAKLTVVCETLGWYKMRIGPRGLAQKSENPTNRGACVKTRERPPACPVETHVRCY